MNKQWESKAKEVYRDGMKFFKEGVQGLEIMAGKTLEVGRIKLANQQAISRIRGLFTDLGQRVFDSLIHASKNSSFKITPDIQKFVEQIKKWQHFIESNIRNLKHLSTVEGSQKTKGSRTPVKKTKTKSKVAIKPKSKSKMRIKKKSKRSR